MVLWKLLFSEIQKLSAHELSEFRKNFPIFLKIRFRPMVKNFPNFLVFGRNSKTFPVFKQKIS